MAIGVSRRELKIALRAGVAELADAPDLGSGGLAVWVRLPSPAPRRGVG